MSGARAIIILRDGVPTRVSFVGVRLTHPLDYRPEVRKWLDECMEILRQQLEEPGLDSERR